MDGFSIQWSYKELIFKKDKDSIWRKKTAKETVINAKVEKNETDSDRHLSMYSEHG